MVFSSIVFLFIYLPIVLAVYYIVPAKWRNIWLFIVNLVFYGWGEPVYILLMLFSIAVNYVNGLLVGKYRESAVDKAKAVLIINVVINLAMLVFFKYYDLIATTISQIPGVTVPTLGFGISPRGPRIRPNFPIRPMRFGVVITTSKSNHPSVIFSMRSSTPT